MITKQRLTFSIHLLLIILSGCGQKRSYLKDFEREWNPYKAGQVLVFKSSDNEIDSVWIKDVMDKRFPEGIGARKNERLRVLATHKIEKENKTTDLSFLLLSAEWLGDPAVIDFEFFLDGDGFWGRGYPIYEMSQIPESSLEIEYGVFNDVIRIEDNSHRPFTNNEIQAIYWSKSVGYLKYERKDGKSRELIGITD